MSRPVTYEKRSPLAELLAQEMQQRDVWRISVTPEIERGSIRTTEADEHGHKEIQIHPEDYVAIRRDRPPNTSVSPMFVPFGVSVYLTEEAAAMLNDLRNPTKGDE